MKARELHEKVWALCEEYREMEDDGSELFLAVCSAMPGEMNSRISTGIECDTVHLMDSLRKIIEQCYKVEPQGTTVVIADFIDDLSKQTN